MNEPILITLKNGGKSQAIEDALCDKNGYNVRYLGENGKYYYPSDIASVLPLDKGKQINERDFCYQIRKDKEELERKIESMLLSFSYQYGGIHIDSSIKEYETVDAETGKKSPMFAVSLGIRI